VGVGEGGGGNGGGRGGEGEDEGVGEGVGVGGSEVGVGFVQYFYCSSKLLDRLLDLKGRNVWLGWENYTSKGVHTCAQICIFTHKRRRTHMRTNMHIHTRT